MILVSCFEPFGGEEINSSLEACRLLEKENIEGVHFCVLPVVWKCSAEVLLAEIKRLKPKIVLSLGQARREGVSLERQAWNWDDFRIPDNAGQQICKQKIIVDAEEKLVSTLPLDRLKKRLLKENISAEMSETAGTFVCNHLFYTLQHALKGQGIMSGFVHVPILPEQAKEMQVSMPLEEQVRAIRVLIEELLQTT